jgi:hypothetical protein
MAADNTARQDGVTLRDLAGTASARAGREGVAVEGRQVQGLGMTLPIPKEVSSVYQEDADSAVAFREWGGTELALAPLADHNRVMGVIRRRFGQAVCDEISAPGSNRLVRCGPLVRSTRKDNRVYYFFLFTGHFFYAQPSRLLPRRFIVSLAVDLAGLTVVPLPESVKHPFAFEIRSRTKSVRVFARSAEEKKRWCQSIDQVARQPRFGGGMDLAPLAEDDAAGDDDHHHPHHPEVAGSASEARLAPVWVKNTASRVCMLCGTKFGLVTRRHHCRLCGYLVCAKCSPAKLYTPFLKTEKPVRACASCTKNPENYAFTPQAAPPKGGPRKVRTRFGSLSEDSDDDEAAKEDGVIATMVLVQRKVRAWLSSIRQKRAAAVIQAAWRGWAARKRYRAARAGIIRVQAAARGRMTRKRLALRLTKLSLSLREDLAGLWSGPCPVGLAERWDLFLGLAAASATAASITKSSPSSSSSSSSSSARARALALRPLALARAGLRFALACTKDELKAAKKAAARAEADLRLDLLAHFESADPAPIYAKWGIAGNKKKKRRLIQRLAAPQPHEWEEAGELLRATWASNSHKNLTTLPRQCAETRPPAKGNEDIFPKGVQVFIARKF